MKVLNKDGLSYFWNKIKNFLDRKLDKDFVVNVSFDENTTEHSADKTFAEILDAYNSDKTIIVKFEDSNYSLSFYEEDYAFYFVKVEGYGHYSIIIMSDNTVSYEICNLQSFLVSGTNIKTVNNNSLLGSGNIELSSDSLLYKGEGTNYVAYGDSLTDAVDELSDAVDDLGTLNLIESITTNESSASGGNNTVTIMETNGTTTSFNIKNGTDGRDGQDGADGVSLGEIALVQTTGDSEESVMSQKATTEYSKRVTDIEMSAIINGYDFKLPQGYTEVEWISNENGASSIDTGLVPNDGNWRFNGSWARTGAPTAAWAAIMSAYTADSVNTYRIVRYNKDNTKVYVGGFTRANTCATITLTNTNTDVWHTYDLSKHSIILDGVQYQAGNYNVNSQQTSTMKISAPAYPQKFGTFVAWHNDEFVGLFIPCISPNNVVGMYDVITGTFVTSTNDNAFVAGDIVQTPTYNKVATSHDLSQMRNLVKQEIGSDANATMSQKAITDELNIAYRKDLTPNYFRGLVCSFKLDDYPSLDVRKCDGFSLVMDGYFADNSGYRAGWLSMSTGNVYNTDGFLVGESWSSLLVGLYNSLSTRVHGSSPSQGSRYTFAHEVITFEFKTGISKLYRNGQLLSTGTPNSDYSYSAVMTYLNTANTVLRLSGFGGVNNSNTIVASGPKFSSIALFGHVLSDSEVASIYGGGKESTCGILIPEAWKAQNVAPYTGTDWTLYMQTGTSSTNGDGQKVLVPSSGGTMTFGFANLSNLINNLIYEWDFTITSGTCTHDSSLRYSRKMLYAGNYYSVFTIYDENGNDVTLDELTVGSYHVVCKPDNLVAANINATSNRLVYIFSGCSSDFSITLSTTLKVQERGAGIICNTHNYRGTYWEMHNGINLSVPTGYMYNWQSPHAAYYDTYKPEVIKYASNALVQFNGQMAIDTTNNKVYVGYLTSSGGIWKQINNS